MLNPNKFAKNTFITVLFAKVILLEEVPLVLPQLLQTSNPSVAALIAQFFGHCGLMKWSEYFVIGNIKNFTTS